MKNFGIWTFFGLAVATVLYLVGHGNFSFAALFVVGLLVCRMLTFRTALIYIILFIQFSRLSVPVSVIRNIPLVVILQLIYVAGEILARSLHVGSRPKWTRADKLLLAFILYIPILAGIRGFGLYGLGGDSIGGMDYITLLVQLVFMLIASLNMREGNIDLKRCLKIMFAGAAVSAGAAALSALAPAVYGLVGRFFTVSTEISEQAGARMRIPQLGIFALIAMPFAMMIPSARKRYLAVAGCLFLGIFSGFRTWMVSVLLLFVIAEIRIYKLTATKAIFSLIIGSFLLMSLWVAAPLLDSRMQRSLSVLPGFSGRVGYEALRSATDSTEWRVELYKICLDELHKYVIVGRGLGDKLTTIMKWLQDSRLSGQQSFHHYQAHSYHLASLELMIDYGIIPAAVLVGVLLLNLRRVLRLRQSLAADRSYESVRSLYIFTVVSLLTYWSSFRGTSLELIYVAYILSHIPPPAGAPPVQKLPEIRHEPSLQRGRNVRRA